jgi:uncharacterized protein
MATDRIRQIEDYVRQSMAAVTEPDLMIAHDFKHVDRVRHWALRIARSEAFPDLELVEAAALLHDIGLTSLQVDQRNRHAQAGVGIVAQFLPQLRLFEDEEIDVISNAIRYHSSPSGGGALGQILRDADKLDAIGAVGIMRAFTSKYTKPEYDPHDIKGDTWGMPMEGFEQRFTEGKGIGAHIIDQVNFQISFYEELRTEAARRFGEPMVEFMRAYVIQLESEINAGPM